MKKSTKTTKVVTKTKARVTKKPARIHIATPASARTGRRIHRLRVASGLSQSALGGMSDLSQNHISNVENGVENISAEARMRVAAALGTTDRYLKIGRKD